MSEARALAESAAVRAEALTAPARAAERVAQGLGELDLTSLRERGEPSRRDTVRRRMLALADLLGLCLAYAAVWVFDAPDVPITDKLFLVGALPLWVVLNKLLGLYDRDVNLIHKSTLDEFPAIALSVVLGSALIFLLAPLIPGVEIGRSQTIVFAVSGMALIPALRSLARVGVRRTFPPERCLVVGSGHVAAMLARKISGHPEYGVELVGFLDEPNARHNGHAPALPLLGTFSEFDETCRRLGVERVVVAFSSLSHEDLLDVVRASKRLAVKVTILPRLYEVIGHAVAMDQVEGMTLMGLRGLTRTRSSLMLKRAIDITGAAVGLLALAPALAVIATAVKLTSRGPVLFRQRRIGKDNEPFEMVKFRTMVDGADGLKAELAHLNDAVEPMFKIADDPRVTPLGRWLRKTSLDELPQLWNVLRGEMSLVGPRPLVPSEDDHVIGWHRARLELTPGLTGPWQVLGRTAIPFEEMIKLDYLYVAEWSLWNDIKLLLRTAPVVLGGSGH